MNWYIGQEIVCVRDHSQKAVVRDQVFVIESLRKCQCNCNHIEINIGKSATSEFMSCRLCGRDDIPTSDNIWWFDEKLFAPLDTLADISELTEILETTKPFEV